MTLFLIIILSVVMVLDCVVLCFLVLMQLPKKEAGAGLAFGGAASDALFGAGSGNFLTKATKWSAGVFFALALFLSLLQSYRAHQKGSEFLQHLKDRTTEQPAITTPPAATPPPSTTGSNAFMTPQIENNTPAPATSNTAPAATPK
jgi:preprotein translocase subunit SecG